MHNMIENIVYKNVDDRTKQELWRKFIVYSFGIWKKAVLMLSGKLWMVRCCKRWIALKKINKGRYPPHPWGVE